VRWTCLFLVACAAAPARAPAVALPTRDPGTVSPLLADVGMRTREPPHMFALRVLGEMGARLVPEAYGAPDGLAFVAALSDRLERDVVPLAGDLVVFEDGWLVGVVTSVRADGTIEFVFARDGVVRRGFLNPARPDERRDPRGRVLNTFVRPFRSQDRGSQRYLGGQLLSGFLRLERLVR
jgi:hypothetical protein